MDLDTLGTQMQDTEAKLSQYNENLPSEIKSQIQKAYTPAVQRSLGVTKDLMGDYLGKYFDVATMGPGMSGSTAIDLSPTQKLGVMGRELGTMAGNLQATQGYSDFLGTQATEMYQNAIQAAQLGQQNLADKYARLSQQYQLKWQEAENEKDRALSASLAGGSGGGGITIDAGDYLSEQGGETPKIDQQAVIDRIQQLAQGAKGARSSGNVFRLNGQTIGNIDAVHNYLSQIAKSYGVRINPEWLWIQLGNTPANPYMSYNPSM